MASRKLKILIISPAFPPIINGLGDYAHKLGKALSDYPLFEISYAGLAQKEKSIVKPYYVIDQKDGLLSLIQKQEIQAIYLNYSNYGYQQKGTPLWLLAELKKVKSKGIQIFIFFHELNASSNKPWQSVFWLNPVQKYIYKKLYALASKCYCSNDRIFEILKENSKVRALKLKKLGIFSNIPEPENLTDFEKRINKAVIFGSFGRRKEIYEKWEILNQFTKDYQIDEIIDIGGGNVSALIENLNVKVKLKGILKPEEIANILNQIQWGLIDYPDSLIGKSGIFAAYSAFGLSIYNLNMRKEKALENLLAGRDYLSSNCYLRTFNSTQASHKIWEWYQNRNIHHHSTQIASDLLI